MKIDFHVHLLQGKDYLEGLLKECQRLGIDKICLNACGSHYDQPTNEAVKEAMGKYPDRVIGFGHFRLGRDSPELVDELHSQGFKGLKVINPTKDYDAKEFYPVYARAEALKMPILFHLGIVAREPLDKYYDVSSGRQRPIHLDTIARAFPNLYIVGAHFGNPWYEEAAETARWNSNVYFDLSGSTLKKKKPEFFTEMLWWSKETGFYKGAGQHPFEKIIFGSDVHYNRIEEVITDYQNLLDALHISEEIRQKIFGETAAKLLGLTEN